MKNHLLLPALACAAIPIIWAALPSGSSGRAPQWAPPVDTAREGDVELATALIPVERPCEPAPREAAAPAALRGDAPSGHHQELPTELRLSEIGPELAARLQSRLALFEEPTDEMYSSWYAGTDFEDLARLHFDAATARQGLATIEWTIPRAMAVPYGFELLDERRASFEKETAWLDTEVLRQMEHGGSVSAIRLASRTDEELVRAYPGPEDRYVLRTRLLQEYNSLVRDAARSEFAKLRAMSAQDRSKQGFSAMT